MPVPSRLQLAPELLRFSRGDQLLLVDGLTLRPLLVTRGAGDVARLLDEIGRGADGATIPRDDDSRRVVDTLLQHGIVHDAACPSDVAQRRDTTVPERPASQALYLLLAQNCNLGCVYCLNGDETYHRKAAPKMSRKVAFRAVELCLERLQPGGSLQVVFFGGEPLLNWPLAKQVIDHVDAVLGPRYPDRKYRFHLTSNLARLPSDLIDRIRHHNIGVLCDVDGPPEIHDRTRPFRGGRGSCARITANVRELVDAGISVALRATITTHNADRMLDVALYHRELGGSGSAMVPVNAVNSDEDILGTDLLPDPAAYARGLREIFASSGWSAEQLFPFNTYVNRIKPGAHQSIACGAPYGNTPVVDVNGDVYACIYLVGMTAYRMGTVFEADTYPDRAVLDRMMNTLLVDNIEECRGCAYRYICAGGCPVGHLLVTANPRASTKVREYHREIRCLTTKTVVESILWDVAQRASGHAERSQDEVLSPCE